MLLASCASEKKVNTHLQKKDSKDVIEQRMDESFTLKRGSDGSIEMRSDKRSAFEGAKYASDQGGFEKKAYSGKAFDGSGKQFARTPWGNSKKFREGQIETPDFVQQAAGIGRDQNEWSDKNYQTSAASGFDNTWIETNEKQVEHTINDAAVRKREELARPKIITSKEHQMKSIEEVRSMMGRDD